MSSSTSTRPPRKAGSADRAAPAPRGGGSHRRTLAVGVASVVLGAIGLAGLLLPEGAEPVPIGTLVGWHGGQARVDEVTLIDPHAKAGTHGMTIQEADPVPAGMKRYRVGLTFRAGDAPLTVDAGQLALEADGGGRSTPHQVELGDAIVPVRASLSGGVVFQVPSDATGLRLRLDDEHVVPLHAEAGDHQAGH